VQLSGGMTDLLRREVAIGELDFAIFGLFNPPGEGLAWEVLAPDPMVPMASIDHPLASPRRSVPWKELVQARWIVTGRQTSTFAEYERNFETHGLKAPQPTVLSLSSLREMTLALTIQALVLVPHSAAREANAAVLAPVLAAGGWHSERHLGLAHREGGYLGPAAQQAMTLFREVFKTFD